LSKKISTWIRDKLKRTKKVTVQKKPHVIISRSNHTISRSAISPCALKVMYRLKDAGYQALLVGGGVRDILLEKKPKDFDVATDAHPEAIRALFRNSRIIGRRFRLVHVFYDGEIIEVSTFRANAIEQTRSVENSETGMIFCDNTFGTIEEDAWRRDFTVNALYYNIADFSIVDYTHGMHDLKHRLIRMIGDPTQRYHEDPVRLLRAIRLSSKLNFNIETETENALKSLSHLLQHVPTSRLFDESLKLFFEGNALATYEKLLEYRYMDVLFPQTMHALHSHKNKKHDQLIRLAMKATDDRLQMNESVNPAFLLAILLWPALTAVVAKIKNKKTKFYFQLHQIISDVIHQQVQAMMIPKRLQFAIQAIWILQFQLQNPRKKRVRTIYQHRYFRAAFDFMGLCVEAGETTPEYFNWWKHFQTIDVDAQDKLIEQIK
jgi:poly(A) polymerase